MDCPICQFNNPPGMRFCGQCGTALGETIPCPACGGATAPGMRFCGQCGTSLTAVAVARVPAAPPLTRRRRGTAALAPNTVLPPNGNGNGHHRKTPALV